MARAVAVRPVLPVAGDRAVDEPRVLLAQPLVADPQPLHHAGAEALEQHVGLAHEPQQHLAPRVGLQVDADRALVAVERQEQRAARALLRPLVARRRPAHVVAEPRVLDLQHVGAEVGQQPRAEAARQQPREVEHADALERAAHVRPRRSRGLGDRRRPPPDVLAHPPRPRHEVAVGARHLPVREVEVVLQPDAHVAAQRQRRGHQLPLLPRDPDHAPLVGDAGGHLLGHVGEVARARADPAASRPSRTRSAAAGRAGPCPAAGRGWRCGRSRSTRARA